ncbi:hypothetical protein NA78x_004891 [Anatilimnocola sp. NA78]|uniref:hypothetical protein n=1 Tax=Anatilimnocola sp. NA78 TaxID=3415683 RepID=UPI003CE5510F
MNSTSQNQAEVPDANPPHAAPFWSVWRTDDNGNVFLVREHLPKAEAQRVADEFESHGHKQLYWLQEEK